MLKRQSNGLYRDTVTGEQATLRHEYPNKGGRLPENAYFYLTHSTLAWNNRWALGRRLH